MMSKGVNKNAGYKDYLIKIGIFLCVAIIIFGAISMSQGAKSGRYESMGVFYADLLTGLLFLAFLLSTLVAAYFFCKYLRESDKKESEKEREKSKGIKKKRKY